MKQNPGLKSINTAQETSDTVSVLMTSQQLTVKKWPHNALLLYQSTNRWKCSLLLLPETKNVLVFSLGIVGWKLNALLPLRIV